MAIIILLIAMVAIYFIAKTFYGKKKANTAVPSDTPGASLPPSDTPSPLTSPTTSISPSTIPSSTPTTKPSASPSPTLTPLQSPSLTPSATPVATPNTQQGQTLSGQASLDGYQSNNGTGNGGGEIKIGRNTTAVTRGFLSFDISSLKGKTITSATLRLYQVSQTGTPYTTGGDLKIDHVAYGDTFDSADYSVSSLSSSFATLSNNTTKEWKEVSITEKVKDDLANNRSHTQYRLHLSTETMGGTPSGDYALFESTENTLKTGNTPQILIK